jgi:hypothetical protein
VTVHAAQAEVARHAVAGKAQVIGPACTGAEQDLKGVTVIPHDDGRGLGKLG